jgi:AcrR family transcriptional regulator
MRNSPHRASRSDGIHTRETILSAAARLATVEGLEGMSLGRLADHIGMSKSGLYAHFGSKEELQLATVETATQIFWADVIEPAESVDDPIARLETIADNFLGHLERDVFPGGCFFVSAIAEFDTRPGPVLDAVVASIERWVGTLSALVREAQARGAVRSDEDSDQLAWELDSFMLMGNLGWVTNRVPEPLDRARTAFRSRLALARAEARQTVKPEALT